MPWNGRAGSPVGSHPPMLGILRADSSGRALLVDAGIDIDSLRTALEDQTAAAWWRVGVLNQDVSGLS